MWEGAYSGSHQGLHSLSFRHELHERIGLSSPWRRAMAVGADVNRTRLA